MLLSLCAQHQKTCPHDGTTCVMWYRLPACQNSCSFRGYCFQYVLQQRMHWCAVLDVCCVVRYDGGKGIIQKRCHAAPCTVCVYHEQVVYIQCWSCVENITPKPCGPVDGKQHGIGAWGGCYQQQTTRQVRDRIQGSHRLVQHRERYPVWWVLEPCSVEYQHQITSTMVTTHGGEMTIACLQKRLAAVGNDHVLLVGGAACTHKLPKLAERQLWWICNVVNAYKVGGYTPPPSVPHPVASCVQWRRCTRPSIAPAAASHLLLQPW